MLIFGILPNDENCQNMTGSVQMKSGMTFIRGNMCIEKEKDNLKAAK